ncbi:MAG: bifunctional [glutamate--ammonia ligase]-adenylyl-L-tyrosine phosphorylase/[glutamate--ammonia-ligase] adenylyltransferase [Methylobacter sp.]|nr:MAG: bifunctional [glutamate--ammonia ligase]-adenylyl-L-tyrosine phosphorylase/[glutamate--ammonia-ligase] adenylyltransferase [Methylobacter sp.]PPD23288.1 MAG: bifunctional [glutamate--ammonia ligase]-adenylyl-L-tyrosine phosphorylase/[glutamate--ammonia-ligase] adenylyltransferase [Methylobacter sp.]PPD36441.1 MAG: bifunctional [glutamate--ammonia ligase]-adenylyl-L-tyrosine phosphorylase/[glutamate--ammonia-ligase] adenylyltransferase [Methylomonas sp.]
MRHPEVLADLVQCQALTNVYAPDYYRIQLEQIPITGEVDLTRELRRFRNKEMLRIAWRDLAGWADLSETLNDLSRLAEACLNYALNSLYHQTCAEKGTPVGSKGQSIGLVVLGMGKLGGFELNFSSDIDLIFAYAEEGVLPDRKQTSYSEFFFRVCRSLLKVLSEITEDGFVFRTDIRLRPFGDSGPIAMTFEGMERYYQTQAREWERYAMIKARQVAGDFDSGAHLMAMLEKFVYRRYLDYGAIEEIRLLKLQIVHELKRKDRIDDVKLGLGGIREIEFIGQVHQLIRGGQDKALRIRPILQVLKVLADLRLLPADDVSQLAESYCFLRKVENHLQQFQDKQTHSLPKTPQEQSILAVSMGFEDWHSFKTKLDEIRAGVHRVFDQVFAISKQESQDVEAQKLWYGTDDGPKLAESLKNYGFLQPEVVLENLRAFKSSLAVKRLATKGARVLDRLMPQLLLELAKTSNPDEALKRMLGLFEAISGRSVYFSLLEENPAALVQSIRLVAASRWLCDLLSHSPVLFDELLDTRTLFEPLQRADLDNQLTANLAQIDVNDLEHLMTTLRQFKQRSVLKVAASDIMGVIPIMVVSDYLTYIAESLVAHTLARTWAMLVDKHGYPLGADDVNKGFAVIGFGKLGGMELGYGSDLDLVFLYDCDNGQGVTNGEKPIANMQFYGRLGLKFRHIMETNMLSGVLYEVDMRLRPNGESGLLVSHIDWYEDYLQHQAWTWEHQALVRARFIAGDEKLKQQFNAIRHRILSLPRATDKLKADVCEMREKMRSALMLKDADRFDLKQSPGGIADIEFIVQFGILDQAAKNPALTEFTDNVRLLDGLKRQGFISEIEADALKAAYCAYRDHGHKLALQGERPVVDKFLFADESSRVMAIWRRYMNSDK